MNQEASAHVFDPLAELVAADKRMADAVKLEADFERITRKLFRLPSGREWLRLAMARYNFNGSVFSAADGMNPGNAAHRDGMRNVISDILNSAFTATTEPENDDDDE